jgi:hypothetical protein
VDLHRDRIFAETGSDETDEITVRADGKFDLYV